MQTTWKHLQQFFFSFDNAIEIRNAGISSPANGSEQVDFPEDGHDLKRFNESQDHNKKEENNRYDAAFSENSTASDSE